jgi:hypothetical protein
MVRKQFHLGYGMVPYVVLLHKGRYYKYPHHGAHVNHWHAKDKQSGLYDHDDIECVYFQKSELMEFATEGFQAADHHR